MLLNVLVIGGGGREHAIVHALKQSPSVGRLYCAPGNPGIAAEAQCVPIAAGNLRELYSFAQSQRIDLTVVGPEAPLVEGLVDHFRLGGLRVVGPTKTAARLEGSKSFAKEFMRKYGIPTARHEVIPNLQKATYQLQHFPGKSVVKADGLCAGKGVKVCSSQAEAKEFLYEVMEKEVFGAAGSTAVIEECLEGEEASILAFCDGDTIAAMPPCQDHKRLLEGDEGPNTGGMGAYAPAPAVTAAMMASIEDAVFKPFMRGLREEKLDYRGIIYFGLMLTASGPQVLEFNVRFGDPETQVLLPLLESDLATLLAAVADRRLGSIPVRWKPAAALTVVLASRGYPSAPEKGKVIEGLSRPAPADVLVFHAGTAENAERIVTAGGRVLSVTGVAPTLAQAHPKAYNHVETIHWDGMQYRRDIGHRALKPADAAAT